MGFINLGRLKIRKKETCALLYRMFNLPRFINHIFKMGRLINSINSFYFKLILYIFFIVKVIYIFFNNAVPLQVGALTGYDDIMMSDLTFDIFPRSKK